MVYLTNQLRAHTKRQRWRQRCPNTNLPAPAVAVAITKRIKLLQQLHKQQRSKHIFSLRLGRYESAPAWPLMLL